MPFLTKAELAMEELLRAEAELQEYARYGADNPEHEQQLAAAVELAVNEFTKLLPELRTGT